MKSARDIAFLIADKLRYRGLSIAEPRLLADELEPIIEDELVSQRVNIRDSVREEYRYKIRTMEI